MLVSLSLVDDCVLALNSVLNMCSENCTSSSCTGIVKLFCASLMSRCLTSGVHFVLHDYL